MRSCLLWFATFIAVLWAILWIGPFVNAVRILANEDGYVPATFTVERLEHVAERRSGERWIGPWNSAHGTVTTSHGTSPNEELLVKGLDPTHQYRNRSPATTEKAVSGRSSVSWYTGNCTPASAAHVVPSYSRPGLSMISVSPFVS